MKKKVVYLGKQSIYGTRFLKSLEQEGYQVLGIKDLDNISEEIRSGEICLMVYSHVDQPSLWKVCTNILENFPTLPAMFILPNDSRIEKVIKSQLSYEIVRPLTNIQKFLTKAAHLIEMGERQASDLAKLGTDSLQNKFSGYLTDFFLENVVHKTLQYFSQISQSRNIYWVRYEQYQRICVDTAKGQDKFGALFSYKEMREETLLRAFRVGSEKDVIGLLNQFPYVDEVENQIQMITDDTGGTHLIAPIWDPLQEKPLAMLIFQDLTVTDVQGFIQKVQGDLTTLSLHLSFSVKYQRAINETLKDDLTGLYNQRYLKRVLDREISLANRDEDKFTVLFLDVDYFKLVNDNMGHLVGSKVLKEIGEIVTKSVRDSDYAFRYGGDEFVILLVGASSDLADPVAERIRKNIENHDFKIDGNDFKLTVSIGLATFPDHAKTQEKIMKLADEAMYLGKNKSRNIVYKAS